MVTYTSEWKEIILGQIQKTKRGKRLVRSQLEQVSRIDNYPVFQNSLSPLGFYNEYNCQAESVFVIAAGNAGDIGYSELEFWAADDCYFYEHSNDIHQKYLYYYFLLNQKTIAEQTRRTSIPRLSRDILDNLVLQLPEVAEQEAIADTLTLFDTHIANLTELIEKKKAIREGALEDLISGKTRLSGFNSEWISISFDEYFTLLSNNTYSRDKLAEHGQVGNIHYGDILIKYSEIVTDEDEIPFLRPEITYSDNWLLHTNDVIIADTAEDETVGKAIQICEVSVPLVGGLHTIVCRPKFETAHGFLGLYINSKSYHDQLLSHITGIKVSSISKKAIKTTVLTIPSEIEEQSAIVGIITAMDKEIRSLEEERDKMIKIREGAMDDLLTGKVRLTD